MTPIAGSRERAATGAASAGHAVTAALCRGATCRRLFWSRRVCFIAGVLIAALLSGCMVGPNYRRPVVNPPRTFRGATTTSAPESASLADLEWFEVFKDPQLQQLIKTALAQNYDLLSAVARVEQARAAVSNSRSNLYPSLAAGSNLATNRPSRNGSLPLSASFVPHPNRTFGEAALDLVSFEADIWGQLRRANEAARANLLAAEETRKAVITTLVSDVAAAYFNLRELDAELEISRRTLATRQESLRLIKVRQSGGIATELDLRQAEQLVYTAAEAIPELEQQIAQTENQVSFLLAENPGAIVRGQSLTEQQLPPEVPAGLPSALLDRRPDISAAEQALVAANAGIGVAKAAFFPQISLTGIIGGQSTELANLLSRPSTLWNLTPQATQPVFTAGSLKSRVRLAEAVRQDALEQYEKSVKSAFTEVSNALIAHQKVHESRLQQELLVTALQERARLAYVRYRGGVDTLLSALDADRDQFQAERTLAQIRLNELLSVVQLYKTLGGGWQ